MRLSKPELVALFETGDYYAVMKRGDWNRDDICIKREDGARTEIQNFPYRINRMPTYIFDELVKNGTLLESGTDEWGGTIFRLNKRKLKPIIWAA